MNEPGPFRRFGIDYAGPMLDDDLTEALIDMVNASGRHVDGADDGPASEGDVGMTKPDATAVSGEVEFWKNANDSHKALLLQAANRMEDLEAEIERLRAALREIRALHQPEWASEQARAAGKEPWVWPCAAADGLWPCATVATIREALGDE